MKLVLAVLALCLCLGGCQSSKTMTWMELEPPTLIKGTGKPVLVLTAKGVEDVRLLLGQPASNWIYLGHLSQRNGHSRKDVANAVKKHGGNIAISGKAIFVSPRTWGQLWAVGKTTLQEVSSSAKPPRIDPETGLPIP